MKKILFAVAILAVTNAHADDWTGRDKAKHAAVSFALGAGAGAIMPDNKTEAFALAMLPGIAKELSDSRKGGSGWSNKDLIADALGAYVGVQLGSNVALHFGRRSVTVKGSFK